VNTTSPEKALTLQAGLISEDAISRLASDDRGIGEPERSRERKRWVEAQRRSLEDDYFFQLRPTAGKQSFASGMESTAMALEGVRL